MGWAALIWIIGNGLGGAFVSGSSLLFGWPGASLVYLFAGVWLAFSPEFFARHYSRFALRSAAVVFGIGAILQCLPSAGFWRAGNANALTVMTKSMRRPHNPTGWPGSFGTWATSRAPWAGINVIVLLWLVACAVGLWLAATRDLRWPIWTVVVGAVVVWVVGQDLSIYGGLATDINSMIPLAVVVYCASPTLRHEPALARRSPEEFRSSTGGVVAAFASAMVIFSVVSMGVASVSAAEPTLFIAQNGIAAAVNTKAPTFTLTDQFDRRYTLGEHPGHFTLMTFLDPVCWTDCPLLAAQLKSVRSQLSANAPIDVVAIAANPEHETLANVRHFISIHQLSNVKDFYFVTGHLSTLKTVWNEYNVAVSNEPGEVMSIHSDEMLIIKPNGRVRWLVPDDPIANSSGQRSSESELLSLVHEAGVH